MVIRICGGFAVVVEMDKMGTGWGTWYSMGVYKITPPFILGKNQTAEPQICIPIRWGQNERCEMLSKPGTYLHPHFTISGLKTSRLDCFRLKALCQNTLKASAFCHPSVW